MDIDENDAQLLLDWITKHNLGEFAGKDFAQDLFGPQKNFVTDPSRFKNALCSRRAGKSWGSSAGLLEAASSTPDTYCPYISLTRKSAKRIIWRILKAHNEVYGLGGNVSEGELSITLPGRSEVFCVGADQDNFVDRIRGIPIKRVIIDEAQSFRSDVLEYLIDEVITPALMDHDGDVWLIGTPGPTPIGYFYDCTQGDQKGWSRHYWTVFDNPHIPKAKSMLEEFLERRGWSIDHPTIQREWFGRWVFDKDATVYKFQPSKNIYDRLPRDREWIKILGVDFGYNDKTAFAVLAYSPHDPRVFIEYCRGYGQMIPSAICTYAKKLMEATGAVKVICDTGGLGKSIAEEMRIRYHLPVEPAEKKEKMANIELFNGDLISGNIKINKKNKELMHQMQTLTKDDKGMEDPHLPNDLCDAVLYPYRFCRHYAWEVREKTLDPNSNEYMDELERLEAEEMERKMNSDGDDFDEYYEEEPYEDLIGS